MAKKSTIPREWLRSHQKDDSLLDGVAVGALASEVLRLRQEVATRDAQLEALAPLNFESATRVELASAAPEPAEAEDDAEATALYQALEYLDRYGLACLWLNREQRKVSLLEADALAAAIADHADRLQQAQQTTPEVPRESIGSPLAAELYMAVRGSYLQALQPSIDEAFVLVASLQPFRRKEAPDPTVPVDANAVASDMARAREKKAAFDYSQKLPISGEKAWDLGKSKKSKP